MAVVDDTSYSPSYYTLDLETYNNKGKAVAYLLGIYGPDKVFKCF